MTGWYCVENRNNQEKLDLLHDTSLDFRLCQLATFLLEEKDHIKATASLRAAAWQCRVSSARKPSVS